MKPLKPLAAGLLALFFVTGCTTLPDVVVKDKVADENTRGLIGEGVVVIKPEHAKQFDDPAWPTPIQVVVPRRETDLKRVSGPQEIYLFKGDGRRQRIERLYVESGRMNECRAAIDGIGLAHREHTPAFIRVGDGGGRLIRCGSVVFESDTANLEFRHPFISTYQAVDLTDLHPGNPGQNKRGYLPEDVDQSDTVLRRYPVMIRYLDED